MQGPHPFELEAIRRADKSINDDSTAALGHADMMREFATLNFSRDDSLCFAAEFDGQLAATGGVMVCGDVGVLAGASTIPEFRRRGAQNALLTARLKAVRERGCDIAMMAAEPGSASQRNAERNGFRIAYTRTKWCKAFPESTTGS